MIGGLGTTKSENEVRRIVLPSLACTLQGGEDTSGRLISINYEEK